jgi:hypothetical protein
MAQVREKLTIQWQKPTTEAHFAAEEPPAEAEQLESAVRGALDGQGGDREVLVVFRRDGTRWRVQAELGNGHGASPDADPRSTLELTRRAVEAVRRAGFQAEPGFPADPNEPELAVNPLE